MRMPVCMTNAIPSCATAGKLSLHWYQLPIVRVAAAFAGRACDWGLRRMAQRAGVTFACVGAGVFVGVLASVSYICIAPHYEPKRLALWQAGLALNRITPSDALMVIAD